MDAELQLISRLRREHRAVAERLDLASPPRRGAPARSSPAALRHVVDMVECLLETMPAHFKVGGCLTCKNFKSCGGSCGGKNHAVREPHAELLRGVEELARALKAGADWQDLRSRTDDVARAFRAQFEDEEKEFHRRVLESGRSTHRRRQS